MKLFWNGKKMKVKNKKTTFAYEEAHPEDGPFCWNYIPVMSRQNGRSITNLYLAAKQAGLPLEKIKELIKDVYGYDC